MTGPNPAGKWDKLEQQAWLNVAILDDLLASLAATTEELRLSREAPVPSAPAFPPQFKSYAEWRAWCEQDRLDEVAEETEGVRSEVLHAAIFEARFCEEPPPGTRFCAECKHWHGGRAYGLCLVPDCDCVVARRAA
jgi:hypothetical protein